jgi:hypothetical protein
MAQPTTHESHPAQMKPTPGITEPHEEQAPPIHRDNPPKPLPTSIEPVLFDDIEPGLLARAYPEALGKGGTKSAREEAMAAAKAHTEASAKLEYVPTT